MRTLCIDIGGTGMKALVVDETGQALTDRNRLPTPKPGTPAQVLEVLDKLVATVGEFDRLSLGFPGVVAESMIKTAPHLDPSWAGYDLGKELERRFNKPVRIANDAVIQGLGVVEGKGFEMVITFGTGMGCGLYIDGKQAGLELGHHPYKKGREYEYYISNAARKKVGNARWNKRVRKAIKQIEAIFNYRKLYIGGGNAKYLERERFAENVTVVDNMAGLLGGIRLWR